LLGLVLCVGLVACGFDESGLGPFDAASDPQVVDVTNDVADLDVVDAPVDVQPEAGCDPGSCQGERCVADACDYYASCDEMHTADPSRQTGVHHFKGSNGPYDAWCDMDTTPGGWTLVARSVTLGSSNAFGWFKSSNTDPTDRKTPYSLSAPLNGLTFAQALVGQVNELASSPNVWGSNVNRLILPSGFPGNFQASGGGAGVVIVSTTGGCTSPQVTMLTVVGFTGHGSQFFFRDNTSDGPYGLFPEGFHLNYPLDCRAAEMDGTPGMIMVR